jgi:hypothetical protein
MVAAGILTTAEFDLLRRAQLDRLLWEEQCSTSWQGQLVLPNISALQHGPHHPHEVARGGHERDLLSLRATSMGMLEERTNGWRTGQSNPYRCVPLRASVAHTAAS